jgi:hypothetical protein
VRAKKQLPLFAIVILASLGCDAREENTLGKVDYLPVPLADCARQPPRPEKTIEISDPARYPCDISFEETAVLKGMGIGVPSPAPTAVVASNGNILTSSHDGGSIVVWSNKGHFIRTVGRSGDGPQEFMRGWLSMFIDGTGQVFARDNGSKWLVYDSTMNYRRTLRSPLTGIPQYTRLMEDGRVLSSMVPGTAPTHFFEIVDLSDRSVSLRRSFGEIPKGLIGRGMSASRLLSYIGNGYFWAAPIEGSPSGYQLEKWDTSGKIIRTIRRKASWFPASVSSKAARSGSQEPPSPRVDIVHANAEGLIFVALRISTPRWRPVRTPQEMALVRDSMFVFRYEVIDGDAGAVLASAVVPYAAIPYAFFPRSFDGYFYDDSKDSGPELRLVRLLLHNR